MKSLQQHRMALYSFLILGTFAACHFVDSKLFARISGHRHLVRSASGGADRRIVGLACDPGASGGDPLCYLNVFKDGRILASNEIRGRYEQVEAGTMSDEYWLVRRNEVGGVRKPDTVEFWRFDGNTVTKPESTLSWENGNPWSSITAVADGRGAYLYAAGYLTSGKPAVGRFKIVWRNNKPVATAGVFQKQRADNLDPFQMPVDLEVDVADGTVYVVNLNGFTPWLYTVLAYDENLGRIMKDPLRMEHFYAIEAYKGLLAIMKSPDDDGEEVYVEVYSGGSSERYHLYDSVYDGNRFMAGVMAYDLVSETCGNIWTIGQHNLEREHWTYDLLQRHKFCSDQ